MYPIATIDYIIIAVYLMGMVGVGLWFAKKHTNFDDFFLAGRSLTTPLLITTLISTYYGIDVLFDNFRIHAGSVEDSAWSLEGTFQTSSHYILV